MVSVDMAIHMPTRLPGAPLDFYRFVDARHTIQAGREDARAYPTILTLKPKRTRGMASPPPPPCPAPVPPRLRTWARRRPDAESRCCCTSRIHAGRPGTRASASRCGHACLPRGLRPGGGRGDGGALLERSRGWGRWAHSGPGGCPVQRVTHPGTGHVQRWRARARSATHPELSGGQARWRGSHPGGCAATSVGAAHLQGAPGPSVGAARSISRAPGTAHRRARPAQARPQSPYRTPTGRWAQRAAKRTHRGAGLGALRSAPPEPGPRRPRPAGGVVAQSSLSPRSARPVAWPGSGPSRTSPSAS